MQGLWMLETIGKWHEFGGLHYLHHDLPSEALESAYFVLYNDIVDINICPYRVASFSCCFEFPYNLKDTCQICFSIRQVTLKNILRQIQDLIF